ncbi:unnamed protein product [Mytilus edulis]|uniref:TIR domain-containing protein n=1 Tax=Mytilus edulis TaxID=6550 RepID=A0A8S3SIC2_MYTED|nr:unnamed protein product [Mytilus edulis]
MIFVLLVKLYNYICVRQLSKYILIRNPQYALSGTCPCNIGNLSITEDTKYDIMIIYNEEEYNLVKYSFVPFFENHKLSVFVDARDMIAGRTKARAYSEAVQSCRNFVIIGSETFVNDQWNNEFILGDLILQMIHEHQGHHVVVVKWNNAEVPQAFRWDPKITIIEWSERRSTSENMAIFKTEYSRFHVLGECFVNLKISNKMIKMQCKKL